MGFFLDFCLDFLWVFFVVVYLVLFFFKKSLTSGSDFTSDFAWPTGVIALAFISGLPCEFPTPATDFVADIVLVMGLT